jgi:hypothetical protein
MNTGSTRACENGFFRDAPEQEFPQFTHRTPNRRPDEEKDIFVFKHLTVATILAAIAVLPATTAQADTHAQRATSQSPEIIRYEKTGGFAGIQRRVSIDRNGLGQVASGEASAAFQLTVEEFSLLRRRLGAVSTWHSSADGCDIADHFTYTLRYRGRSAVRCHTLPRDWEPAVAQLDQVIDRHLAPSRPPAHD